MVKKIFSIAIAVICIFESGCFPQEYANGVKNDSLKTLKLKKQFFTAFSFNGIVYNKLYCNHCKVNEFQIVIRPYEINNVLLNISNVSYNPYYDFSYQDSLVVSVSKELFNYTELRDTVKKYSNSRYLTCKDSNFLILNLKDSVWMP